MVLSGYRKWGFDPAPVQAAAQDVDPQPLRRAFLCGATMRGEPRGSLLPAHARRRPAHTRGRLVRLDGRPGLVWGDDTVRGELVDLDDPATQLGELDRAEEFAGWIWEGSRFERTLLQVYSGHRGEVGALAWGWRYAHDPGDAPTLIGGSWRARDVPSTGDPVLDALERVAADVEGCADDPVVPTGDGAGPEAWGGADVVIAPAVPRGHEPPVERRASDVWVVTPHAEALAWLFHRLATEVYTYDTFGDKHAFYRTVAGTVLRLQAREPARSERDTLRAAVGGVRRLLLGR